MVSSYVLVIDAILGRAHPAPSNMTAPDTLRRSQLKIVAREHFQRVVYITPLLSPSPYLQFLK